MGILSAVGAALGAMGSKAGSSILGSMYDNDQKRRNMRAAVHEQLKADKELGEWSAKNLPKMNREGMSAAGFNPVLAIADGTGQMGSISTPLDSAQTDTTVDMVDSALRFRNLQDQHDLALKQQALLDSQANVSNAQALKTASETDINRYKYEHPETLQTGVNQVVHNITNTATNLKNDIYNATKNLFDGNLSLREKYDRFDQWWQDLDFDDYRRERRPRRDF